MTVLVVYPTVGSDTFDAVYADRVLAETRADGFRVHLDRRYPERNQRILDYVSDKTSVIILQLDDYMPRVWDVVAIEDFASDIPMMTRGMDVRAVEIGNEPLTMHKMSAATYAAICNRIAPQLSPLPALTAVKVTPSGAPLASPCSSVPQHRISPALRM